VVAIIRYIILLWNENSSRNSGSVNKWYNITDADEHIMCNSFHFHSSTVHLDTISLLFTNWCTIELLYKNIKIYIKTSASSNNTLPDDGDWTKTCRNCFNVNFNILLKQLYCASVGKQKTLTYSAIFCYIIAKLNK
jgi:hypothetical protein